MNKNLKAIRDIEKKETKRKLSESNRVGFLKRSKKYAPGREYNTLEGRIKITNRYLENGEIMISYIDMSTGKLVLRSELDTNTLLYEYAREVARNLHDKPGKSPSDVLVPQEGNYTIDEIHALRMESEALEEALRNSKEEVIAKQKIIEKQFELIEALMEQLKRG